MKVSMQCILSNRKDELEMHAATWWSLTTFVCMYKAKGSVLCDSVCMTFWKKPSRHINYISGCWWPGGGVTACRGHRKHSEVIDMPLIVEGARICPKESPFSLQMGAYDTFKNVN